MVYRPRLSWEWTGSILPYSYLYFCFSYIVGFHTLALLIVAFYLHFLHIFTNCFLYGLTGWRFLSVSVFSQFSFSTFIGGLLIQARFSPTSRGHGVHSCCENKVIHPLSHRKFSVPYSRIKYDLIVTCITGR